MATVANISALRKPLGAIDVIIIITTTTTSSSSSRSSNSTGNRSKWVELLVVINSRNLRNRQ